MPGPGLWVLGVFGGRPGFGRALGRRPLRTGRGSCKHRCSYGTRPRLTDLLPGRAVAHVPVQRGHAALVNRSVTRAGELQLGSVICGSAHWSAAPLPPELGRGPSGPQFLGLRFYPVCGAWGPWRGRPGSGGPWAKGRSGPDVAVNRSRVTALHWCVCDRPPG